MYMGLNLFCFSLLLQSTHPPLSPSVFVSLSPDWVPPIHLHPPPCQLIKCTLFFGRARQLAWDKYALVELSRLVVYSPCTPVQMLAVICIVSIFKCVLITAQVLGFTLTWDQRNVFKWFLQPMGTWHILIKGYKWVGWICLYIYAYG